MYWIRVADYICFFDRGKRKKMENKFKIIIEEKMKGARLDVVLSLTLKELSRNHVQKLIEAGQVMVNHKVCNVKKMLLKAGDEIEITIPEPEELEITPENIPLEIVYEDQDLLIINKPKGMVVHPAVGNQTGTIVNAVMYHCGDSLSSINGVIRPGIVHRLDKETSGLLMIAKMIWPITPWRSNWLSIALQDLTGQSCTTILTMRRELLTGLLEEIQKTD